MMLMSKTAPTEAAMAIFVVEDKEFHFCVVVWERVPLLLPSSLMALRIQCLDAAPATRSVAVFVLGNVAVGVGDTHGLHGHGVGAPTVVGQAAGPFDGAVGVFGVPTSPDAQADVHGGLGEVVAAVCVGRLEGADDLAVDVPVDFAFGPVGRVVVPVVLGVGDRVVDGAVEGGGVAFAEVVGFHVGGVAAHEFPVDFVEVVGFEHDGGDDALAAGGFHDYFDLAAEDVEVGLHGGGVTTFVDCELGAVGALVDGPGCGVPYCCGHDGVREVYAVVGDAESDVERTVGAVHGIA